MFEVEAQAIWSAGVGLSATWTTSGDALSYWPNLERDFRNSSCGSQGKVYICHKILHDWHILSVYFIL